MRAARFRGSRIRSPSSRNELIEKDNRQKARQRRAFSLSCVDDVREHFHAPEFLLCGFAARKTLGAGNPADSIANLLPATRRENFEGIAVKHPKGYPIPLGKKSRVRLVTYRQCAHHHFEKTSGPLKRKYFVNFFLSSCEEYCSYFDVSIRRADSTPCHLISKAAALLRGRAKLIALAYIAFHARCARNGACYQLTRSRRPRLFQISAV